jgi:hypothetical protein
MRERLRSNEVIDLAAYRERSAKPPQRRQKPVVPPERLLDEVSYHLLMAARAIAAHTSK